MIKLFLDLLSVIISGGFTIWIVLLLAKIYYKKKNKSLKPIFNIEKKFKNIVNFLLSGLFIVAKMVLCVILAIGVKPTIYNLNTPLGYGYATFASYLVAICLWIILGGIELIQPKGKNKKGGNKK